MIRHPFIASAILPLASAVTLAAQQPGPPPAPAVKPPSFPAQVEQVIVDVVVTDKKGVAVGGLKREDMTVLEDGVPQNVVSFEPVQLPDRPAVAPPPPPRISINTSPAEQRGRTFVIVFDDTHLTPWRANPAKAAVANFLEKGVREGDRVELVSTAGGAWWTARMESGRAQLLETLKHLEGRHIPDMAPERMSDAEALRINVYHDSTVEQRVLRRWEQMGVQSVINRSSSDDQNRDVGVTDPLVSGRAMEIYHNAVTRIRTTLDTLERVINGLATAKGRKSVILVSEGFIEDMDLDEFKRVSEASRRANAAVYFVNARGLEAMPMEMTAQFGPAIPEQDVGAAYGDAIEAVAGAEDIASSTGGFTVRNTNDLSQGVQRIANETQAYYLLGYVPSNTARDGRFRKIQVKLAQGKGLQVRARKGYYAPSDDPRTALVPKQKGIDPAFQAAVDSPWMHDAIPLRMTDFVGDEKMLGKVAVRVVTEVDVRTLPFESNAGRSANDLEMFLVVTQRQSGEYFRYNQTISLNLLPATRERLARQWFPIVRDFELSPGDYQAKMVVREKRGGGIGTIMHDFVVPPVESFRVSTPVLSDVRAANRSDEGVPGGILEVIARREFPSGGELLCSIEVYGAKKDDKTGMPSVSHGYLVRRSDGAVVVAMPPSVISPTSLGHVSRLFGFRLVDFPPGAYEMVMAVRDDLAGRTIEAREPFTVVAPLAQAAPAQQPGEPSRPSQATPPAAPPGR